MKKKQDNNTPLEISLNSPTEAATFPQENQSQSLVINTSQAVSPEVLVSNLVMVGSVPAMAGNDKKSGLEKLISENPIENNNSEEENSTTKSGDSNDSDSFYSADTSDEEEEN